MAVLKANTKLSEHEIQHFYDRFKSECPSGKMNKQQFYKFYEEIMGSKMQHSDAAEYAFTMIDTNHDESIDFTEFVLFFGMEKKRDLDSRLEMMFEITDTSGDGFISYEEMVNIMQKATLVYATINFIQVSKIQKLF
ncbi:unnamed protein product [Rotaria sordida]|uniref:EF-hand domain-containing protein n=1 Tax=Rotaria sordida TaxID=392033 RepID=A0A814Y8X5_9BILA|nr:unnamed protein product [Rotaria sordida]